MDFTRPIVALPPDLDAIPDAALYAFLQAALATYGAPGSVEAAQKALDDHRAEIDGVPRRDLALDEVALMAIITALNWARMYERGRRAGDGPAAGEDLSSARYFMARNLRFQELRCECELFGPPGDNRGWGPTDDFDGFELTDNGSLGADVILALPRGLDPDFVADIVTALDSAYASGRRDGAIAGPTGPRLETSELSASSVAVAS